MFTAQFGDWLHGLDEQRKSQVQAALRRVENTGPTLRRPRADSIHGSRVHNLKELRLHKGLRVLFAFDPDQQAVMLVGGDKTGSWKRWYRKMIPVAEHRYRDHLRSIGKEDRCLSRQGAGLTSGARSR